MEDLEDEDGQRYENHVCLFLPEIVSPGSSEIERHYRQLSKMLMNCPQISKIHVLTYFMRVNCLQRIEHSENFKKLAFYPLFLNNELCQYHCLYSDKAVADNQFEIEDQLEMSIEMQPIDDILTKSKSAINPSKIGEGLKLNGLEALAASDDS